MAEERQYPITDYYDLDKSQTEKFFSKDLFRAGEDIVVPLRDDNQRKLNAGGVRLLCGYCKQAIQIYGECTPDPGCQHYHFRHYWKENLSDEHCPYRSLSEKYYDSETIRRMKYKGLPANPEHDRIQNSLLKWLQKWDEEAEKEKYLHHISKNRSFRKADVYGKVDKKTVVFEVQRTSTSVKTIVGRDDFYREQGMYILWVITHPEKMTCAKRDIFYDNAENFFVYDDDADTMSEEKNELCLTCYYCDWTFDNDGRFARCDNLFKKTMPFRQLTFNEDTHMVYFATPDELKRNYQKEVYKPYKKWLDEIMEEDKVWERKNRLNKFYYDRLRGIPSQLQSKARAEAEQIIISYIREVLSLVSDGSTEYDGKNLVALLQVAVDELHIRYKKIVEHGYPFADAMRNPNIPADLFLELLKYEIETLGFVEYSSEQYKEDMITLQSNNEKEKCCMLYSFAQVAYKLDDPDDVEKELYGYWRFYAVLFSIVWGNLNLRFGYQNWKGIARYVKQYYPTRLVYLERMIDWKITKNNVIDKDMHDFVKRFARKMGMNERAERVFNVIFPKIQ